MLPTRQRKIATTTKMEDVLKEEKDKIIEQEKKDNARYPAQKNEIDEKYRTAVLQSDKLKREINRFVPGSAWKMFLDGEEMTGIVTQVRTPGLDKEGKSNPFVPCHSSFLVKN